MHSNYFYEWEGWIVTILKMIMKNFHRAIAWIEFCTKHMFINGTEKTYNYVFRLNNYQKQSFENDNTSFYYVNLYNLHNQAIALANTKWYLHSHLVCAKLLLSILDTSYVCFYSWQTHIYHTIGVFFWKRKLLGTHWHSRWFIF